MVACLAYTRLVKTHYNAYHGILDAMVRGDYHALKENDKEAWDNGQTSEGCGQAEDYGEGEDR
jgi:hypothetical protein